MKKHLSLLYRNYCEDAVYTASSGPASSEYLVSHHRLQKQVLEGAILSWSCLFEFGSGAHVQADERAITAFALSHNIDTDVSPTIRVRTLYGGGSEINDVIDDSDVLPLYPVTYGHGESSSLRHRNRIGMRDKLFVHYLPSPALATAVHVSVGFDEATVSARDYFNYLYAGEGFIGKVDVLRNVAANETDPTEHFRTTAGNIFPLARRSGREITFQWEELEPNERIQLDTINRLCGRKRSVIVDAWNGEDEYEQLLDQLWGYFEVPPRVVERIDRYSRVYTSKATVVEH